MTQRQEQRALPFYLTPDMSLRRLPISVAFVEAEVDKPLHRHLLDLFREEFIERGDQFSIVGQKDHFPRTATAGLQIIDDGFETERHPGALYGRHEKPRNGKKAVYILTTSFLPSDIGMADDSLSLWLRGLMTRKPSHNIVVIEGASSSKELQYGARAAYSSMEGNTQVITYKGDNKAFIHTIAQCLRDQAGSHSVTRKEGIKLEKPTFEAWRTRYEVANVAYASPTLAAHGRLTDVNLHDGATEQQVKGILNILESAGLTTGNLAAVVRNFAGRNAVMAMTETGIKKTQIDPVNGEVIAVTDLMPDGARYLILEGLSKGNPRTLFRHPSWAIAREVVESLALAISKKNLKEWFASRNEKAKLFDHPFSVEGLENAHAFRFAALIEAGIVSKPLEYFEYHADELQGKEYEEIGAVPFMPKNVEVASDAAVHTHESYKDKQRNPLIEGVPMEVADEDMRRLGFTHIPTCGSAEALVSLIMQTGRSYEIYGIPKDRRVTRLVHLRGHGTYGYGYEGIRNLADRYVEAEFMPHTVRYPLPI